MFDFSEPLKFSEVPLVPSATVPKLAGELPPHLDPHEWLEDKLYETPYANGVSVAEHLLRSCPVVPRFPRLWPQRGWYDGWYFPDGVAEKLTVSPDEFWYGLSQFLGLTPEGLRNYVGHAKAPELQVVFSGGEFPTFMEFVEAIVELALEGQHVDRYTAYAYACIVGIAAQDTQGCRYDSDGNRVSNPHSWGSENEPGVVNMNNFLFLLSQGLRTKTEWLAEKAARDEQKKAAGLAAQAQAQTKASSVPAYSSSDASRLATYDDD